MPSNTQTQFIAPAGLEDRVLGPQHADFDQARQAWNLALDQRPVAIALPRSDREVAALVRAAAEQGLKVAAQATGHGAAAMGPLDATVLLRTDTMRGVEIDVPRRLARVQAGAIWADVTDGAGEHGLTALAGSARDVGVVGYTLGGGMSWMVRQHGLAVNHVSAIEVVTADGEIVRASAAQHEDLFYALRGAPGSFGVVTAIEFALFEISEVFAGMLLFPIVRAREVLEAYLDWTGTVPETVTSLGRLLNLPPLPAIPEQLRGRSFVGVEAVLLEDPERAGALLEPLRALGPEIDTFAVTPVEKLGYLHMDPPGPVPGVADGTMLESLDTGALDALVLAAGEHSGSPLLSVELRHLGGAASRRPADAGATGSFAGDFCVFAVGMAVTPEMAAAVDVHLSLVLDALEPWRAKTLYINASDRVEQDVASLFSAGAYERLRALKERFDPNDLFRANHQVGGAADER